MRLKRWQETGLWLRIHHLMLRELKRRGRLELETTMIDSAQVRAFGGGDRSGPNPVDRRNPGTKYTVLVDAHGTPLAMQTAAANVSDHRQILSTVVRYPQIGGTPGRPRNHPTKLYTDAGDDSNATRELLMVMGIEPIIRRRRTPHGSHLGKVRWVVERTISWIKGLRRMRIRYDRPPPRSSTPGTTLPSPQSASESSARPIEKLLIRQVLCQPLRKATAFFANENNCDARSSERTVENGR